MRVVSCEVRDAGWAGIQLLDTVPVHDRNVVNNAGPGMYQTFSGIAEVTNMW